MMSRVFKRREKLLQSYVPDKLPYREHQIKWLKDIFSPILSGDLPCTHAIIVGNSGVGKTAVVKKIAKDIENENPKVRSIYINCRFERTPGNIVRQLVSKIVFSIPLRGLSIEEMFFAGLKQCAGSNEKILLILDDSDFLFRDNKEFVYMISRVGEVTPELNLLSLLIVIHSLNVLSSLDPWTAGGLRKNILYFESYNYDQMVDILDYRVSEAFYPETVLREAIETCADISLQYGGNARYALELILRAGEIAEAKGDSVVVPEHIRLARKEVPPSFSLEEVKNLSLHEKLVLLSISEILGSSYKSYLMMGELENQYRRVCEEMGIKPVMHTWIWKIVNNLAQLGFISKRLSGRGIRGRSTLIGLTMTSARTLESFLRRDLIEIEGQAQY